MSDYSPKNKPTIKQPYPVVYEGGARIAIGIEYNGSQFFGWQRQQNPEVISVQGALENAIAKVADHPIKLFCAGRTDARVHATHQVAHYDVRVDRGEKAWVQGVNSHLPDSICVLWARPVNDLFHARYTALSREYQYWIENTAVKPAILSGLITPYRYQLDAEIMHSEAQCLLGENDFSAFRAASCESSTPMRNVYHLNVFTHIEFDRRICIEIKANAFLLHMVRNIAGSLLSVGCGRKPKGWLNSLMLKKDRNQAEPTAKPDGLYLCQVDYPPEFNLPIVKRPPF